MNDLTYLRNDSLECTLLTWKERHRLVVEDDPNRVNDTWDIAEDGQYNIYRQLDIAAFLGEYAQRLKLIGFAEYSIKFIV